MSQSGETQTKREAKSEPMEAIDLTMPGHMFEYMRACVRACVPACVCARVCCCAGWVWVASFAQRSCTFQLPSREYAGPREPGLHICSMPHEQIWNTMFLPGTHVPGHTCMDLETSGTQTAPGLRRTREQLLHTSLSWGPWGTWGTRESRRSR